MVSFLLFCAQYLYLGILILAFVYLFFQKRILQKTIFVFAILSLAICYLIGRIASFLYYDPRPFVVHHVSPLIYHVADNGFPSDHALLCFSIAAIVFVFNKRIGFVLTLLGFLVGWGRVFAGIHSWLDIFGSFFIAYGGTLLLSQFMKKRISIWMKQY